MALGTYARNPAGKHTILGLFAGCGYELPDTPMMAVHRGDVARLENHFRRDPHLFEPRFTLREIHPSECGCAKDGQSGMHWTPIDGTTLLHIAIDFREREIFEWLLARGADVNARAAFDCDAFGGHTPLFNAVVCGPWPDAAMSRALIEHGADASARASLRKFLDWIENPHWHEARNVTAREWGNTFPERNWVNREALRFLDESGE
jgi:ankyrin repeat protein